MNDPAQHKSSQPIFCANCLHCKEFWYSSDLTGVRERRVRCAAGQWKTPAGREKTFSIHTVLSRRKDQCPHYESMGDEDLDEYITTLRNTLPVERIIEHPPAVRRKTA